MAPLGPLSRGTARSAVLRAGPATGGGAGAARSGRRRNRTAPRSARRRLAALARGSPAVTALGRPANPRVITASRSPRSQVRGAPFPGCSLLSPHAAKPLSLVYPRVSPPFEGTRSQRQRTERTFSQREQLTRGTPHPCPQVKHELAKQRNLQKICGEEIFVNTGYIKR